MQKVSKVTIKPISKTEGLGSSRVDFKISGDNINYIIANTIRRTILSDIPIYAFSEFKFDKNTSIFHNNYLKLRLMHMPIWGIENDIEYLEVNQKKNNDVEINENEEENNELEFELDKTLNSSSLKQFTMYVNYKNKSEDIVTVTTDDAKFYYGEKQINSPYNIAIPLVKLQRKQEIAFSAITKIGTEQINAMFSAVCVAAYKEINDNEFDFFLESRGQISEKRILEVALINIEKRLNNFIKLLSDKEYDNSQNDEDKSSGIIIVNNEDNTLGNLISRGLQQHEHISFAGYNLPHPLAKKVHFHYKLNKDVDIKKVMKDVVNYYNELFSSIRKEINSKI